MRNAETGKGYKLHAAMRKYGVAAFEVRERAIFETQDEAFIAERILIALEAPAYNLTAGGEGVHGTAEVRAKISAKATGRKHTPETRAKLRAARIAQGNPPKPAFTPAHRKALSEAHIGLKQSAETKAKRSASLKRAYAEGRRQPVTGLPRGADGRILPKARV